MAWYIGIISLHPVCILNFYTLGQIHKVTHMFLQTLLFHHLYSVLYSAGLTIFILMSLRLAIESSKIQSRMGPLLRSNKWTKRSLFSFCNFWLPNCESFLKNLSAHFFWAVEILWQVSLPLLNICWKRFLDLMKKTTTNKHFIFDSVDTETSEEVDNIYLFISLMHVFLAAGSVRYP